MKMIRQFELNEDDIKTAIANYIATKEQDIKVQNVEVTLSADTDTERGMKFTTISGTAQINE